MIDALPWILSVSLWLDNPPKIIPIYSKVYPNYEACMEARKTWDKKFVALCGVKTSK